MDETIKNKVLDCSYHKSGYSKNFSHHENYENEIQNKENNRKNNKDDQNNRISTPKLRYDGSVSSKPPVNREPLRENNMSRISQITNNNRFENKQKSLQSPATPTRIFLLL